jgi:hypothetical protein
LKKFLFFALLSVLNFSLYAQSANENGTYTIKGKLLDSVSHRPLDYATISVFLNGNKKPVNGTVSDSKGNFTVKGLVAGKYKLVAEFLGYQSHILPDLIVDKDHPVVDVNDISLQSKAVAMQNIVISGKQKLLRTRLINWFLMQNRILHHRSVLLLIF